MKKYGYLREKILLVCGSIENFAEVMNKSRVTISLKLNGKVPWTVSEIEEICKKLGIPKDEIPKYFFYE